MRVLVVLVLAVFTAGCNANLLFADAPKSKLDELSESFWGYVGKTQKKVDETYEKLMKTEFVQELSASLQDGAKVANMYAGIAWDQMPEGMQHGLEQVGTGAVGLGMEIERRMVNLKTKLEPVTETVAERVAPVAEKVGSVLSQRGQQAIDFATPYVERLLEKVDPVVKSVESRLDNLYQSF